MDQGPITLTAYAERLGVTSMAVSKAVRSGRLSRSVTRDRNGRPKIRDVALADEEWERNVDRTRAHHDVQERAARRNGDGGGGGDDEPPSAQPGMSLAEAAAAEKVWRARLAELSYRAKSGELVPARDVSAKLAHVFTACRTKLLGVPSRAKQALPHLTAQDVAALDELVREALEELAAAQNPLDVEASE